MITNVGTGDKVHNEENNISHGNAELTLQIKSNIQKEVSGVRCLCFSLYYELLAQN